MSVKVSIIVPCYGVEKYLDRCMDTLVNQTLKDIEIILVDDGSPDRVPIMCDEWSRKDDRIKVIHKVNRGLGYARNSGLEIATGEFVAFVDSDDYVSVNMYEALYKEARLNTSCAVFCGCCIESRPGKWVDSNEVEDTIHLEGILVRNFLLDMIACAPGVAQERKYQMSVWHAIYKRSIIHQNKISFPSERIYGSEDIPFQIDFLKNASRISYVKDSYYNYCLNESSITTTINPDKFYRFKKLHQLLLSKFEENDTEALLRIDRFFIGYMRSTSNHLIQSSTPNKINWLGKYINDDIWSVIKCRYRSDYLPILSRIYYLLVLRKNKYVLVGYIHLLTLIKFIVGRHK